MRVHRTTTSGQSAVLFTVVGLYVMFVSGLLVLLGNTGLARRLRADAPSTSTAWILLNLFVVFLGIRLALGLRVAYAAPSTTAQRLRRSASGSRSPSCWCSSAGGGHGPLPSGAPWVGSNNP